MNLVIENFHVRQLGEGDSCVVLGHGVGSDQSVWRQILHYINFSTRRVITYDLACSGSVNPELYDSDRYSSIEGFVDDLLQILDALNVQSCIFIGHAFSAMIGITASVRCPHRFIKLVLIGASARYINDINYHGGIESADMEDLLIAMERNHTAWVHGFVPELIGADMPEAIQEFSRTFFNMRPDISRHVLHTIARTDLRGILHQVTVRCHIIQTRRDLAVPTSAAEYLRDHLGGPTTLQNLPIDGHLPHLSAPRLLGRAIRLAIVRP